MAFTQTRFLGASIRGLAATIGWNEQATTVTVELVEDTPGGDRFAPPPVGSPVRVAFDDFAYEGLLQHYKRAMDFNGNPTYTVSVTDPRELLHGVQVILASYTGSVAAVPNFINAYGFWEDRLGFGGAMSNESGMLWQAPFEILSLDPAGAPGFTITPDGVVGVKPAIEALTARGGPFGGPVRFRGHAYAIDLSGLPTPPPYYRVAGVGASVLDLVSALCQDAGCDYIVYLDGGVVRFRTVSRTAQPAIGTIAAFVAGHPECVSRAYGVELRNEVTNAVLLGDTVRELVQVTSQGAGDQTIWPYWGKDVDGDVIVGQGDPAGDHTFSLDATEVVDIVGDTAYPCSVLELRYALADFESWACYVMKSDPDKAQAIGLANSIDAESDLAAMFPDVVLRRDLIAQRGVDLDRFGKMNEETYWMDRAQAIYSFVNRVAAEFYGKKFLVAIPFAIYWKFEPETTNVIASEEPADAAYYPEQGTPLGLPYDEIDWFLTPEGLFECFVAVPLAAADLTALEPEATVIGGDYVYVKAAVDTTVGVVYPGGSSFPHVVVTLGQAVFKVPVDPLGGIDKIADLVGISHESIVDATGLRHGSFPIRLGPEAIAPAGAAVPMRNNRQSYGPWGTFAPWGATGVPGRASFEHDESLNPWTYGDFATLNRAAAARLAGAATNQQEAEMGSLEVPGTPAIALGAALVAGGPNVTDITCTVGTQGVTTRYEMRTYTPQFGAFQKANADRLRRLGTAALHIRKLMRLLFRRQVGRSILNRRAYAGAMTNAAHAVRQMTPHDCILATQTPSDAHKQRTQVSTLTVDEMMANCRADDPDLYRTMGGMGLEGLYRPFSTAWEPGDDGAGDLPHFEQPADGVAVTAFTTGSIDPIRFSDIDLLLSGQEYPGTLHRLKGDLDYEHARGVGFRTPMVLVGYGLEITGKPTPNAQDESQPLQAWAAHDFAEDAKLHPEKWKAGSLLVHWDKWRKGWTVPSLLKGTPVNDIANGATGKMWVSGSGGQSTGDQIDVTHDLGGGTLKAGTAIWAAYQSLESKWYVISAACTS